MSDRSTSDCRRVSDRYLLGLSRVTDTVIQYANTSCEPTPQSLNALIGRMIRCFLPWNTGNGFTSIYFSNTLNCIRQLFPIHIITSNQQKPLWRTGKKNNAKLIKSQSKGTVGYLSGGRGAHRELQLSESTSFKEDFATVWGLPILISLVIGSTHL